MSTKQRWWCAVAILVTGAFIIRGLLGTLLAVLDVLVIVLVFAWQLATDSHGRD